MRTFIIGDIHGHVQRLAELLDKAKVTEEPTDVVLLGDVGHYDADTKEQDLKTWKFVHMLNDVLHKQGGGITVLWGNHDYANVSPNKHAFRGHVQAEPEVMEIIRRMEPKFAVERHGYLLTHAGLAPRFAPPEGTAIEMIAEVLNGCEDMPVIDDISYRRGGFATQGGILWRDESEKLHDVPQVFGHSRGDIRRYGPGRQSWCIDVAQKEGDDLAGLWLPERRIVAVGENAPIYETPWEDSE